MSVNVFQLKNNLGFVLIPEKHKQGYLISFRGGTGKFGKLDLEQLYRVHGALCARTGKIIFCPEYGPNDTHVGTSDLNHCALALKEFHSLFPNHSYNGAVGISRGCTQAWRFLLHSNELRNSPLVLWCPVFDYDQYLIERPDIAEQFKKFSIDEKGISERSASKHPEIKNCFSSILVLGARKDTRVPVHHSEQFAKAFDTKYHLIDDEHCFPMLRDEALTRTSAFFQT